jgi:DNA repair photolyase
MKPLYEPKGRAKEYGDLCVNIYTGCPHRCFYCYAPAVLRKDRETFHANAELRQGLLTALCRQLADNNITGKMIHLCFTCDPYPLGCDNRATRAVIKILKESGNHVQILTKNGIDAERDFDLLDGNDWFGVTYAGYTEPSYSPTPPKEEPNAGSPSGRLHALCEAHERGIKTWVSMEPVLDAVDILDFLELHVDYIDRYKIGKLNYHPSNIDWKKFGCRAESICRSYRMDYYIKEDLRREMEEHDAQH